jgi:hypothetical protein
MGFFHVRNDNMVGLLLFQVRGFRLTQHCLNSCLVSYFNNRYMFRSYDHLQVDTYLLELTLLKTDPLFLEYQLTS